MKQYSGKRDAERAAFVRRTAELRGVSTRYVEMVINGERENELIIRTYMEIAEGFNVLLIAVKELVPF